jgi:hypothetical protein
MANDIHMTLVILYFMTGLVISLTYAYSEFVKSNAAYLKQTDKQNSIDTNYYRGICSVHKDMIIFEAHPKELELNPMLKLTKIVHKIGEKEGKNIPCYNNRNADVDDIILYRAGLNLLEPEKRYTPEMHAHFLFIEKYTVPFMLTLIVLFLLIKVYLAVVFVMQWLQKQPAAKGLSVNNSNHEGNKED